MAITIDKETLLEEVKECGKNPSYFLKNYVRIAHPTKGLINFNTFDFQDVLLKDFNDKKYNIILKSRQLGISTIVAGYCAWLMLFRREKNILVVATKFKVATNILSKVKKMLNSIPAWLKIAEIKIDNTATIELTNGSTIKASTTSVNDAGRSEALSLLVIDEAAHIDGMDQMWMAVKPTLSAGGKCIALSSPNGIGNWFYRTYVDAEDGKNDFYPTRLPWNVHPERDEQWFQKECRNMTQREIAQEYGCSFLQSGETVINPEDLERIKNLTKPPKYKTGFDRNYWIWEEPKDGASYIISADVARGDSADFSVFHIINLSTRRTSC